MLSALELNSDVYKHSLGIDIDNTRHTLICGIDFEEGKNLSKKKEGLNDRKLDELNHRHKSLASSSYWYSSYDYSQILADAYGTPVYVWPVDTNEYLVPMTFLPINLPKNTSIMPSAIHLQFIDTCHWGALKLNRTFTDMPPVYHIFLQNQEWKSNFGLYWNRWKQFKKMSNKKPVNVEEKDKYI